ncbi:siderophore-interacting protein [Azorhizobium caulinodans]|nr:siderophore-interacting protein [Azorhizobium caulinodans]
MTDTSPVPSDLDLPRIERVRHDLRRRRLTVAATERLTPHMIRITLSGAEMEGFTSLSPADHIKIFVPDGQGGTQMRDYTPRRYDAATGTLLIDFAVHEAGPATRWALDARVGDEVEIGGPRGSMVIGGAIRNWLLIGDETALPSIGRRIEEFAPGTTVTSLVAVPGPEDEQRFETEARLTALWVHRRDPREVGPLLEPLKGIDIPAGTFVWLAAEASVTRAIRAHLLGERQVPPGWLRASGYWVHGTADATEKFED